MSWPTWGDSALWFLVGLVVGMGAVGPFADWLDSPAYREWREDRRRARKGLR